jgi:hypothetical protein
MLRRALSRLNRILDTFTGPTVLNGARAYSPLKARFGLEALEAREVPANLTWMNFTGDGAAMNPADWLNTGTNQVATVTSRAIT